MLFKVKVQETQWEYVEIEASSPTEAEDEVEKRHFDGCYNLDESQHRLTTYEIVGYYDAE